MSQKDSYKTGTIKDLLKKFDNTEQLPEVISLHAHLPITLCYHYGNVYFFLKIYSKVT